MFTEGAYGRCWTGGQMTPLLTSSGAILVRTVALQATLLAGTATAAHEGDVAAAAHQVREREREREIERIVCGCVCVCAERSCA